MSPAAGFVLDLHRCVGCGACVLACRIENQVPAGVSWRRVVPLNLDRYNGGPTYFFSLACHHCENPPCARGCPSGALEKREDGVVLLRGELCLGCRYCEMACPFGAPAFHAESGVMTKCHLCHHRLDEGGIPACVEACPTEALRFRRASDPVAERGGTGEATPGFVDPGEAGPGLAFRSPGGELRSHRFRALQAALEGREDTSRGQGGEE